jgi:hypothetical protein
MRKPFKPNIEESILTSSRRRCAICYGLHKDITIKSGQIAHLDQDPSNNDLNNLCFLCFDHHDKYDSKTSQSKGFTILEVQKYRKELYTVITTEWNKPPVFNSFDTLVSKDGFEGHYIFEGSNEIAEFDIKNIGNNAYQVQGLSLWGTKSLSAPHTGSLDFISSTRDKKIYFADRIGTEWYNVEIKFADNGIEVLEQSKTGYHGLNVTFNGKYRKL